MEVGSDGMEEAIDSRWEMKARPCGIMCMAKLRWPRRERSWHLVQQRARRKLGDRKVDLVDILD